MTLAPGDASLTPRVAMIVRWVDKCEAKWIMVQGVAGAGFKIRNEELAKRT
jgi:hypothetical protein